MDPTNNFNFEIDLDLKQLSKALQSFNSAVQSGDPRYDPLKQQFLEILQKFKDVEFNFTITKSYEDNENQNEAVNSSAENLQNRKKQGIVAEYNKEDEKVQHRATEKHSRKSGTVQNLEEQSDDNYIILNRQSGQDFGAVAGSSKHFNQVDHHLAQLELCYETCVEEHQGKRITCMQFCPKINGLDSSYGWLITASDRLVNLWSCSPAILDDREQPLQVAHSQETGNSYIDIDVDADLEQIFAGCRKTGEGGGNFDCISLLSLKVAELLADKGSLDLKDSKISNIQKVCSLNSLGGKLSGCVAAATASSITVSKFGGKKIRERGEWCAHESQVTTQLQLSSMLPDTLISASSEGVISLWDMRDKPEGSILSMRQHGQVSGICEIGDNKLLSSSFDSYIRFWDVRSPKEPFRILPSQIDERLSVFKMAASPQKDMLAVLTMDKVNIVGINDWNMGQVQTVLRCSDISMRPLCVDWNTGTEDLYVAGADAKVRVFKVI